MGNSKSLLEGLNKLSRQGRLGEAAKELAAVALAAERPGLLTKAAEAERLAGRVSSPAEQQTYLKLAAKWRQEAGAA